MRKRLDFTSRLLQTLKLIFPSSLDLNKSKHIQSFKLLIDITIYKVH